MKREARSRDRGARLPRRRDRSAVAARGLVILAGALALACWSPAAADLDAGFQLAGIWWSWGAGALALVAAWGAGLRLFEARQRARERHLKAELARMMEECEGCRLTVELTRERDSAARQAEKLAEIERLKSELFANVSHEFRTPLTLTLGPLRDLLEDANGELPAEAREQVELANRSAERLLGFVDQILDTARMESGRLELRARRGDLAALVTDLAERFQPMADRRGLSLRFVPPAEPILIWGDPGQLEKVFANLLSNAMRYTPGGGLVEITVEKQTEAGTVAVTVRDEGRGIAAEDQERIFDRFDRAARPALRGDGGIGLGLPLARQLAELHGGSLTLESALGEGSAFRVDLRLGREHFAASQIAEHEPWRLDAAAEARELLPDLLVSDVAMPEMDGYRLCRALKQDPELDWVPVVLLTKMAAADDKLEGLHEGADAYLTKPFDVRELVARVDNLIASRRRLRERFESVAGPPCPRLPLAPGVRPTAEDLKWLARVRETIEAGFGDDEFSVEALAERLAVHRSRLYKRLRQLTGMSPLKLIVHLRLERAAALLEGEAASVSEAAYAAGFHSVSHFSNRFKERFGKSPSTYRREAPAAR